MKPIKHNGGASIDFESSQNINKLKTSLGDFLSQNFLSLENNIIKSEKHKNLVYITPIGKTTSVYKLQYADPNGNFEYDSKDYIKGYMYVKDFNIKFYIMLAFPIEPYSRKDTDLKTLMDPIKAKRKVEETEDKYIIKARRVSDTIYINKSDETYKLTLMYEGYTIGSIETINIEQVKSIIDEYFKYERKLSGPFNVYLPSEGYLNLSEIEKIKNLYKGETVNIDLTDCKGTNQLISASKGNVPCEFDIKNAVHLSSIDDFQKGVDVVEVGFGGKKIYTIQWKEGKKRSSGDGIFFYYNYKMIENNDMIKGDEIRTFEILNPLTVLFFRKTELQGFKFIRPSLMARTRMKKKGIALDGFIGCDECELFLPADIYDGVRILDKSKLKLISVEPRELTNI